MIQTLSFTLIPLRSPAFTCSVPRGEFPALTLLKNPGLPGLSLGRGDNNTVPSASLTCLAWQLVRLSCPVWGKLGLPGSSGRFGFPRSRGYYVSQFGKTQLESGIAKASVSEEDEKEASIAAVVGPMTEREPSC